MSYLKITGGIITSVILLVWLTVRFAFEIIGLSTAPEDFSALKQRMPKFLEWLFSTPWPAPTLLMLLLVAASGWLIWSGVRKTTADQVGVNQISESFVESIVRDYLEQNPANQRDAQKTDLSELLDEALRTKMRAEFAQHSDIHPINERLLSVEETAKNAKESAALAIGLAKTEIAEERKRIDQLVMYAEHNVRETDRRFLWIDGGFMAILHRERLTELALKLEADANSLLRIRNGENVGNWGEWESDRSKWMSTLQAWVEIADIYRNNCSERIFSVTPEELQGEWPENDGLFPGIDAIMAYRKIGVLLGRFRLEQKSVDRAVTLAAHHRPSMKSSSAQEAYLEAAPK